MNDPQKHDTSRLGAYLMALFGIALMVYCSSLGFSALKSEKVQGRLGALHQSGSAEFAVSLGACGVGLALGAVVVTLGLRHARSGHG